MDGWIWSEGVLSGSSEVTYYVVRLVKGQIGDINDPEA